MRCAGARAGRFAAGFASAAVGVPGSGAMMLTAGIEDADGKSYFGWPGVEPAVWASGCAGAVMPEASVGSLVCGGAAGACGAAASAGDCGAIGLACGNGTAPAGGWFDAIGGCWITICGCDGDGCPPVPAALTATAPGFQASE